MEKVNEGIFDSILDAIGLKVDDPKKSDFVSKDVDDLYSTLENAKNKGGLEQQSYGNFTYQKEVESLQIALSILADKEGKPNPLPIYGIDGLFGPETAIAVKNFVSSTDKIQELFFVSKKNLTKLLRETDITSEPKTPLSKPLLSKTKSGKLFVTPEMIDKILSKLKSENIQDSDLELYLDRPVEPPKVKFGENNKPKIDTTGLPMRTYPSNLMDKFKKIAGSSYDKFINDVTSIGLDPLVAVKQLYNESSFNPEIVSCKRKSPAGAMGIAQFMPQTWNEYGKGSPCNVKDSLDAYVKFMNYLIKRFPGRLDLAVAAYNSGPNLKVYKYTLDNNLSFETLKGKIPTETFIYSASVFQA